MMVRTRIAPSPTGFPHIGTAYQALFNYAFAKKNRGQFILRIEDTDVKRTVPGAVKAITQALEWLGLKADEGPFYQSRRLPLYRKYALDLVKKNHAYFCFCSQTRLKKSRQQKQAQGRPPKYDRRCRQLSKEEAEDQIKKGTKYVVRLKVPDDEQVIVPDLIRGKVIFESNLLDDQVLLKSDGYPTYHLAVVVDDYLMKITHVVRGEEWLSSAPKHVLLYRFFDWPLPKFIHTSLLRNSDKSKLSKRHGHTSIFWYQEQGYLPEALLNFLALLGWSHPKGKEVFSLEEFIELFRFEDLSAVGPIFNLTKLDWLNGVYIRQKSASELVRLIKRFAPKDMNSNSIKRTIPLVKDRMVKLSDYSALVDFLMRMPQLDINLMIKKSGGDKKAIKLWLELALQELDKVKNWRVTDLEKVLRGLVAKQNLHLGKFFMAVRIAVTGKTITPPLFESMELLGRKETLRRFNLVIKKLA